MPHNRGRTVNSYCAFVMCVLGIGCMGESTTNEYVFELLSPQTPPRRRLEIASRLDGQDLSPYTFPEIYSLVHDHERPSACWTAGKACDFTATQWAEKLVLWWAAQEGYLQIANGGFVQFFHNEGGERANEVMRWFKLVGDEKSADAFKQAIALFDGEIAERERRLAILRVASVRDQLRVLDEEIGATMFNEDEFEQASEVFLRDECGIGRLIDAPGDGNTGS